MDTPVLIVFTFDAWKAGVSIVFTLLMGAWKVG